MAHHVRKISAQSPFHFVWEDEFAALDRSHRGIDDTAGSSAHVTGMQHEGHTVLALRVLAWDQIGAARWSYPGLKDVSNHWGVLQHGVSQSWYIFKAANGSGIEPIKLTVLEMHANEGVGKSTMGGIEQLNLIKEEVVSNVEGVIAQHCGAHGLGQYRSASGFSLRLSHGILSESEHASSLQQAQKMQPFPIGVGGQVHQRTQKNLLAQVL